MQLPLSLADTPVVILTGAGASVPLGLPATTDFLNNFRHKVTYTWTDDDPPGYLRFVQDRLQAAPDDIESVLGLLERETQALDLLMGDPVFVSRTLWGGNPLAISPFKAMCDKLIEAIYDEIILTYGNVDATKAQALYNGLLGNYQLFFGSSVHQTATLPFFTLNYDTAVEEATSRLQIRCVDGIVQHPTGPGRYWTPTAYLEYEPAGTDLSVLLVKLHGSVRLAKRDTRNGPIFEEVPAGMARNPYPLIHRVLYPSPLPKPITEEPFRTGYRMLTSCLNNANTRCLVVIGCSFRDPELNTVLRDALEDNPNLHLIVVDPALDDTEVGLRLSCDPDHVRVIQIGFAPEDPDDLRSGRGRVLSYLRDGVGAAISEQSGTEQFRGTVVLLQGHT